MTTTGTLLAFHGDPAIKAKYLDRVRSHREADCLVQGTGWEDGKGCAVGCTFEAYDHSLGPAEIGVPERLMHLEDAIFEGLENAEAMLWPEQFLAAIPVGADLSLVWPRFALWLLTNEQSPSFAGSQHELVKDAITGVAALYRRWVDTGAEPEQREFASARSAAASAAESAAASASTPWSAARSAWAAAASARSAESAAAESVASAAESVASAAESARLAARSAARIRSWRLMRDKLLELLQSAQ